MSDNEYEQEQQGSQTFPKAAGDCQKGDYVIINGHTARVLENAINKTGKHGHAKSKITAIDIFTGVKVQDVQPADHSVDCPYVTKAEYEVVSIDSNDFVTFIARDGHYREDLRLPDEEENEFVPGLRKDYGRGLNLLITVTDAMGKEQIMGYRENKK